MRILHVVHEFVPYTQTGVENYTYALAKEQAAKGNEVFVFCRISRSEAEEYSLLSEEFDGIKVTRVVNNFSDVANYAMYWKNDKIARIFGEYLDKVKPDFIHFQHVVGLSASTVSEAERREIPMVLTLHDYYFMCFKVCLINYAGQRCKGPEFGANCGACFTNGGMQVGSTGSFLVHVLRRTLPKPAYNALKRVRRAILRLPPGHQNGTPPQHDVMFHALQRHYYMDHVLNKFQVIIAPSQHVKRRFVAEGADPKKIAVITHGMETARFDGIEKTYSKRLRFGYVGRFTDYKGVKDLVKAFKGIKDAELLLFGPSEPTYLSEVRKLCAGQRNIRLMGTFKHDEIREVFSTIDVLVVPSNYEETFGLTVREAFISKTPVIVSDAGALPEAVRDGVDGLVFKAGDVSDLREKIEKVIGNPELVGKMKANITKVKDIGEHAAELGKLYKKIIST